MPKDVGAGGKRRVPRPPTRPPKPLSKQAAPRRMTVGEVQGLLPEVNPEFIGEWMGGGGTVNVANPQVTGWNRSTGRAIYNYPGLTVPGQIQGPGGSFFRAPSPSQTPIFVTGMNREQMAGNLLHEMYHAFQRQKPWLRGPLLIEALGGAIGMGPPGGPGEYAAFRLSNRQVQPGLNDWIRYTGFLK